MDLEVTGLDETINFMEQLQDISSAKETKILKEISKAAEEKWKDNIVVRTGKSKRSIKTTIKNTEDGKEARVKVRKWYYTFPEWGSSKSKKNVGKLLRATNGIENEAERIIDRELNF